MQSFENRNLKRANSQRIHKEKWIQLISDCEKSNESQTAFCKRLNLNTHTFTYVKGKLSKNTISKKFIPVSIKENITPTSITNITLENPQGLKLHISSLIADEKLIHLLKLAGW